ncbi:hypothetical protein BKA67DRAFT_505837, partial [Truncatella angustata]
NQNNLTALTTILAPEWVDNPQTRGTSSILWSCVLTTIGCVYSALHLNVPQQRGFWSLLGSKGKWILTALLVPQVTIYSSIDLRLCFFITMGAVQIRVADAARQGRDHQQMKRNNGTQQESVKTLLINPKSILTLSSTGVCQLLQMGHWIPITSDTIDRKSNFNPFEKGLVVLQVYWFATQCITRKIYGLPISLLELHTVIHILSAGIMYSFWFNVRIPQIEYDGLPDPNLSLQKPLDIREPEVLDDMTGEVLEVMAHMSLLSKNLRRQLDRLTFYGALTDFYNDASNNGTQSNSKTAVSLNLKHLYSRRRLSDIVDDLGGDYFEDASILAAPKHNLYIEKDAVDLVSSSGCQKQSIFNTTWMALVSYLELTLSHWTNILLALTFPTLYGGAHLMAVGTSFPSIVELHIWKAACFVIVGGIPCLWLSYTRIWIVYVCITVGLIALCSVFLLAITMCIILAKLFLIIESFISLRSAPIGVFWAPFWVQVLPH